MEIIKNLLTTFKSYPVEYKGRIASHNDIYGSNNWRVRKTLVDKYKKIFTTLLKQANLPQFNEFGLVVVYNSRHDPDNLSEVSKIIIDVFKEKRINGVVIQKGYVIDDSKKYYKLFCIIPDDNLPKNTIIFNFIKFC